MTHLEMKELLEAVNVFLGGEQAEVKITDVIELPEEAQLYLFDCDGCESSAICYKDGTTFVLTDWQSGRPESYDEIEDFAWICASTGREAIMFDGMPRILFTV